MEKDLSKKIINVILPLAVALFSILVVPKYAASPELHAGTIAALDEKRTTVMELTAASTAASAAITLIPGDVATPIADKLADLSGYFLIVLCAIYLEKYLVTITGYAAFTCLIPLACAMLSCNVFLKSRTCRNIAVKLVVFAAALFLVIPASVQISGMIEATYRDSIQATLDAAKESSQIAADTSQEETAGEEQGFFEGLLSGVKEGIDGVTEAASGAVEKAEHVLSNFIEALAVMIVTSCVIPIVVLLFFIWLIKVMLGVNLDPSK